jgi:hypothetical protein
VNARNTNINSYLDDEDVDISTTDLFEEENENEVAERSSVIQVGWSAARKVQEKVSRQYATDFKFEEDVQLIKFLSSEPMIFSQHWVNRTGKKSFVCLGTSECPLCRTGNKADNKFAFSVVNLMDEEATVQLMTVGLRLCGQLEKLNNDPKTGPLDRMYWAVSKSGQGTKTSYSIMPVKERDLPEDWDLDVEETAKIVATLSPLGVDSLRMSTKAELADIARELPED